MHQEIIFELTHPITVRVEQKSMKKPTGAGDELEVVAVQLDLVLLASLRRSHAIQQAHDPSVLLAQKVSHLHASEECK